MSTVSAPYDRWLWIELIGFDNERSDYGVEAYLANAGFVPEAVSLLLYNPDLIHTHDGMERDRVFPVDYSSYSGHPCSYERQRQDWTKHQLRALIGELHKHGIAVYVSVFDLFVTREWVGEHPELWHMTRRGDRIPSVCPWKRFEDGTYYEDFFASQLSRVLVDYSFDGFHQADGYSHPRLPLYEGDYSEDLIEQFVGATSVDLPEGMGGRSGDDPTVVRKRAEWVWRNARREWIQFHASRVQRFCRRVAEAVHAKGKKVVLNNALTRDPFQALYRYGVDYKRLADASVDGFIVETVAPGVALEAESGMEANPHYDYQAMLLLMKSCLPNLKLRCLNNTHDVNEQWDVLRHGSVLLEREIYCQSSLYCFEDVYPPDQLFCGVYGASVQREVALHRDLEESVSADVMGIEEPLTFVEELPFRRVSVSFVTECARVIAECAGAVRILRRDDVIRVQALEMSARCLRLLVGNDSHYYVITGLDMGREIESIRVVTPFPGTPPAFRGSEFGFRVPGKGMVVMDVTLKEG